MKKTTKVWLIVSVALVFVGLAVFAGAMTMVHWDFTNMGNGKKYETNTYDITESFESICVNADTDDISFILSDDKSCRVVCYEQEKLRHTAEVNDHTLEINAHDTGEWYEHISLFSFDSPKMTVYLPKESYASLLIDAGTGDINIPKDFIFDNIDVTASTGDVSCGASSNLSTKIKLSTGKMMVNGAAAGKMDLSVSTGEIRVESASSDGAVTLGVSTGKTFLTDVTCKSLASDGSTGDISLKNVVVSDSLSIERSTGDVTLDGCDADEIFIKTSTGDVTGTLLSEKVFLTDTSTGDVNVPKTVKGGQCEITTTTGDINVNIIESQ